MPDMEYTSEDLRTGAGHADSASQSAASAAAALGGAGGGSPFGAVRGAADLHGAVGHAQQHHAIGARTSSENLTAASERATGTAALGDENTAVTTKIAPRSDKASSVSRGM